MFTPLASPARALFAALVFVSLPLMAAESDRPASPLPAVVRVTVDPPQLRLNGPESSFQLLVRGELADGTFVDLTRAAEFASSNSEVAAAAPGGVVRGMKDGQVELKVSASGQSATVPTTVAGTTVPRPIHFENDIVPLLNRFGCNGSGCHGKAEGQNGFKLSVFGFDPPADRIALIGEARGRRINAALPEKSLLLLKATGEMPHGGGVRIRRGSTEYRLMRDWIVEGTPLGAADAPHIISLKVTPNERQMRLGEAQQLRAVATYSDGREVDVTPHTRFQSNNEGLASVDEFGLVTAGKTPGEAAIMAAYMGAVDVFRAQMPRPVTPGETRPAPIAHNFLDPLVEAKLLKLNIQSSPICDDAEFCRRAFLDIIGTLPTSDEARAFLADQRPDRRARLVDALLERPEYADYWALKWSDLLRVDRQVLGHKGAHAYYRWIRQSIADNKPYDRFVREIVAAEGLLSEQPQGQLFKVVKEPGKVAATFSQVFLGIRIECAQCHHHPFDRWSQTDYFGMTAFVTQTSFKSTPNGELIAALGGGSTRHPRTNEEVFAHPLGTANPTAEAAKEMTGDRRRVLAAWMTDADNPYFAENLVNRMWAHFLGRGIVEPVDDIRLTNPPTNPELLKALADSFAGRGARSGRGSRVEGSGPDKAASPTSAPQPSTQNPQPAFDLKALIRTITASAAYQRSSKPNATNELDEQNYSRALFKRLDAEVLFDAVCQVTGVEEKFDGVPAGSRAVQVWDSHVPHYFLRIFGRPQRATACECERTAETSVAQVLHVLNSPEIQAKLTHAGGRLARLGAKQPDNAKLVEDLYLTFYARTPTAEESTAAVTFLTDRKANRPQAVEDLAWSLMNTVEFLFNH